MLTTASDIALMARSGPAPEISQYFGIDFFSVVLPWLLVFAIVYGVLSQLKNGDGLPKNNAARGIIAIVLAFIIAPALSTHIKVLARLSAGFTALLAGLLLFVVFAGVIGINKEKVLGDSNFKWFTTFVLIVLALLVFVGSNALEAIGIQIPDYVGQNYPLLFFLGFMVLVIWWMIQE